MCRAVGHGSIRGRRKCGQPVQPDPDRCQLSRHSSRRPRSIHGRSWCRIRPRRQLAVLESVQIRIRILRSGSIAKLHPLAPQACQRHLSGQRGRILESRTGRQSGRVGFAPLFLARRSHHQRIRRRRRNDGQPLRTEFRHGLLPQIVREILHGRSVPLYLFGSWRAHIRIREPDVGGRRHLPPT